MDDTRVVNRLGTVPKLLAAGFFALLAAFSSVWSLETKFTAATDENGHSTRWGKNYLPNLEVIDQDGKTFRFYDDLIAGKIVVINFMFTGCSDICPLTMARLAIVQDNLGDALGRDVQMYSVSIDPEHDDVKALKRSATAFGVKPGWKLLTGKPEDIYQIRQKLGERSRIKSEHRHELMLGNAVTGEWGRDSAFGDLDQLANNIRAMDPVWRKQVRQIPADEKLAKMNEVKDRPGEGLFIKACAACHTVGKGDHIGPDLHGVTDRRSRDWLMQFITRPDRMLAQNDATALALAERFPGARMPNLQITENDVTDLLAYIDARTYNANLAGTAPATPPAAR